MGQPPLAQRDTDTARTSQVQTFLFNLELGLRAAQGGQISFNRAVLTFPPSMKEDIYLREAAKGRLDVYGFLAYATAAMPGGMSAEERRRANELVTATGRILMDGLSSSASERIIDGLTDLSMRSERFAAMEPAAQAAQFNEVIGISRRISDALNGGNQEPLRTMLTTSRLGVGVQVWAGNVLDIVFDRDGRVRAEIERRSDGGRTLEMAFNSYIGFSEREQGEVSRWLTQGGKLSSGTFNKLYNLVTGDVRGQARDVLRDLRMDFSIILNNTAQDGDIQNIYDINMHLGLFRRMVGES